MNTINRLQNQKLETVRAENFACKGNVAVTYMCMYFIILSLSETSPAVYDHKTCKVIEKVNLQHIG